MPSGTDLSSSPTLRNPLLIVVTAAGGSSRFGGGKKELARLGGISVLDGAVAPFLDLPTLAALVVTAPPGREDELRSALSPSTLARLEARVGERFRIVAGGSTRRDSVLAACEALARIGMSKDEVEAAVLLVHDGARPWATAELVARVAAIAAEKGSALPVTPLVDTPKEIGSEGRVIRHPGRSSMSGAQTPQGFRFLSYLEALRRASAEDFACTDDAEVWDRYVGPVWSLPGEEGNRKVTYRADLPGEAAATERGNGPELRSCPGGGNGPGRAAGEVALPFRVGSGWDLHRLVPGRRLMLGGVEVPSELGEEAHSDGDVLLHAIVDALLGAAALGDIGTHFPPSDARWKDADSRNLARASAELVRGSGWEIGNLDCTVVLERPKLGPCKDAMRDSIAACLGVPPGSVSVKAKTSEGVDAAGELRAVEAHATVLLVRTAGRSGGTGPSRP